MGAIPSFFREDNVSNWGYRPDHEQIKQFVREQRAKGPLIPPSHLDRILIHNVITDGNLDFTMPDGALPVMGKSGRGGMDDVIRCAKFMYKNGWALTDIVITGDRHRRGQIFFTSFWLDRATGEHPNNNIMVLYRNGRLVGVLPDKEQTLVYEDLYPDPALLSIVAPQGKSQHWLYEYCIYYCQTLEKFGKDPLYLWNEHCMAGEIGSAIHPLLLEAAEHHAELRRTSPIFAPKGDWFLTENYGPLRPEVLVAHDGTVIAHYKEWLYNHLRYGKMISQGWASSHCELTMREQWAEFMYSIDPELVRNGYIMEDCSSPVVVRAPDGTVIADFTEKAERGTEKLAKMGMHVVRSTTPIEEWPGMEHLKAAA